jgi:hypothetical protein
MMSKLDRVKTLPWALLLEGGLVVRGRWRSLPEQDRAQLLDLARRSRGWPRNLSPSERSELSRLLGRLDLQGLARELVWLQRAGRKGRSVWKQRRLWIERVGYLAQRGR